MNDMHTGTMFLIPVILCYYVWKIKIRIVLQSMPRLISSLNDMRTCTMFLFAVIPCYYDLDFKICVNDQ